MNEPAKTFDYIEEAQSVNIAKLCRSLTEYDANNRNLFEERKTLEQVA